MQPEELKALTRRIVDEIIVRGDLDRAFDELVHPDYVDGYVRDGREAYRELIRATRTALSELDFTLEDIVAEGDTAAIRFTIRGTHSGEFLGVGPTGKRVEFAGTGFLRFRDGKLIERWNVSDVHGLLEQLRADL